MKPNITTVEQLYEARPDTCEPAREWLAKNNITHLADAWDRCHRADWMLWLCNVLDLLSDRERRLIACKFVRETPLSDGRKVWDLLTYERSRRAVAVAEKYAVGDATDEQLAAVYADARDAVMAASARANAAYAAAEAEERADAADATRAVWAARSAAATAARDATDAVFAAMASTSYAAAEAKMRAYAAQADLIREIAGNPWRGKENRYD